MKSKFAHYYQPSNEQFEILLRDCVFVLDANVLLNLYRYPRKASDDLLRIIEKISEAKRIWVPFQAALEFQENRLAVIAEQKGKFSAVKNVVSQIEGDLRTQIDKLQLRKRHSSINPDLLIKNISKAFQAYVKRLDALEAEQTDVHQEDHIRLKLDRCLAGAIGDPFTQGELEKIYSEGESRYKCGRPPGYKDAADKKESVTFYKELTIKRKFGDLLVWKELIAYIQKNKPKAVVFVTDDAKEDWWNEIAGKRVGPRPDLLSELHDQAKFDSFYMYTSEQFMKRASALFEVAVEEESIKQVKILSSDIRPISELQRRARELRILYQGKCQICEFDGAVEVATILPLESGGAANKSNMLLLCPNHHRLFDLGVFSIDENLNLLGLDEAITFHSGHNVSVENLRYHRSHVFAPE